MAQVFASVSRRTVGRAVYHRMVNDDLRRLVPVAAGHDVNGAT